MIIIKQKSGKFAKNPCNYCGDGVIGGTEECDGETDLCGEVATVTPYINTNAFDWDFESPSGRPAKITETLNKIYGMKWADHKSSHSNITYHLVNKNGNGKDFYGSWSDKGTGWIIQTVNGLNAYCTTTYYSKSMTQLTLTINAPSAGSISFDYYGGSEGKNHCSGGYEDRYMHDGLLVYLDKTLTTGNNAGRNADLMISGDCRSWQTYSKSVSNGDHELILRYFRDDNGTDNGDKFCIDNIKFIPNPPSSDPSTMSCSNCKKSGTCYGYCGNGKVDDFTNGDLVYLKFNEGSGSSTINYGSLGGSYSVNSSQWTSAGKRGYGYTFNGGGYISTASLDSSVYYNNFTMMAWVKPNSGITMPSSTSGSGVFTVTNNAERYIFGASHGGEPAANPAGAGVAVGTNGIFVTAHGGGYLPALAYYSATLSSSQWHHVAVVFENKVPKIYLNGVHVATGSTPTKNVFPSSQVGGGSYGNFDGSLDDVRIINKVLSASDIKLLMGEICDDGADNGKSGKCKIDCSGE